MEEGEKVESVVSEDERGVGILPNPEEVEKLPWMDIMRQEIVPLWQIALPVVASSLLTQLMQIVDIAFVGHLGEEELGIASIAITLFNMIFYALLGSLSALDTFLSQAYGKGKTHGGDRTSVGRWAQRGTFVVFAMAIVASMVWVFGEPVLRDVFQQNPFIAKNSARFVHLLMPGLPFWLLFQIQQKFLVAQGDVWSPVVVSAIANGINVLTNYLFIHAFGLGIWGSPIATSTSRCSQVLMLFGYIFWAKPHVKNRTWGGIDCSVFSEWGLLLRFLKLAIGGAVMLALETWCFEMTTMFAGLLHDIVALDAHTLLLNLSSFCYLSMPFGLSIATTIRIGNLLGEGYPRRARASAYLAILSGTLFMFVTSGILVGAPDAVASIFTDEPAVIDLTAKIAPICGAFQIADGIQGVTGGALRGVGFQLRLAIFNLVGFWFVAIPSAYVLAFVAGHGVYGLWYGLAIGLVVICFLYSVQLYLVDWDLEAINASKRTHEKEHIADSTVMGDDDEYGDDGSITPSSSIGSVSPIDPGTPTSTNFLSSMFRAASRKRDVERKPLMASNAGYGSEQSPREQSIRGVEME